MGGSQSQERVVNVEESISEDGAARIVVRIIMKIIYRYIHTSERIVLYTGLKNLVVF